MRNWVLTAYSAGTVSFCSGKALIGRRRSAKSSGVGIVARARMRQSEGTLPFPFDPEGTDVMVLEADKLVLMSRSDHRVVSKSCQELQADRSSGFLSLTRASCDSMFRRASRVEKTQGVRASTYRDSKTREIGLS